MTPKELLIQQGNTPEQADELLARAAQGPPQHTHDEIALKKDKLSISMYIKEWAAVLDALEAISKTYSGVENVSLNPNHTAAESKVREALTK